MIHAKLLGGGVLSRNINYRELVLWILGGGGGGEIPWCFSQVKGTIEDEVADGEFVYVYMHLECGAPLQNYCYASM